MRRLFSKNARLALSALPVVVGCALAQQGDPPLPIVEPFAGAGGEETGGSTTGGTSTGGTGVSGASGSSSGTSGASTGGTTGGSSGSATGGSAGQGGTAGTATGGTAGQGGTAGTAGQGGTAGTATGGSGGSMAGSAGKGGTAGTATGGTAGSAGTGVGGSGGIVFSDNFDDGNAVGWTNSGTCSWSFPMDGTNGTAAYAGGGGSCRSTAGSTWTNQTVQSRMKILSFGNTSSSYRAGIVARSGGGTDYYSFLIDAAGDLQLRRGTSTLSGSGCSTVAGSLATLTWYWLRMQVSGSASVRLVTSYSTDGTSFMQVHDCTVTSSTIASGNAGVITGGDTTAEFDDFEVRVP
jgi:hypothetical protein